MDTRYLVSAVVLATLFCLAILVTALLWKKDRSVEGRRRNSRVLLRMAAVMVPVGLVETLVFWRAGLPLVIPLPLLGIGLLFLATGLAGRGRGA